MKELKNEKTIQLKEKFAKRLEFRNSRKKVQITGQC